VGKVAGGKLGGGGVICASNRRSKVAHDSSPNLAKVSMMEKKGKSCPPTHPFPVQLYPSVG